MINKKNDQLFIDIFNDLSPACKGKSDFYERCNQLVERAQNKTQFSRLKAHEQMQATKLLDLKKNTINNSTLTDKGKDEFMNIIRSWVEKNEKLF